MHVSAACRHWYLRFFSWKPVGKISLWLLQAWIWPQEIAEYFLVGEKKKKGERGKRKDKTLFSQLTFSAANCFFFYLFIFFFPKDNWLLECVTYKPKTECHKMKLPPGKTLVHMLCVLPCSSYLLFTAELVWS